MGGTKKKGVVGAASPWPDHSYNHQDHNQRAHAAAILSETVELKQIADRTQGLPPRDLFIRFMSSVEDLAVKGRDCESQSGQTEVLQQLHQIQNMLNKQTEEMKTLQQPLQSSKATNSPPASSPPSQAKSYRDAALSEYVDSVCLLRGKKPYERLYSMRSLISSSNLARALYKAIRRLCALVDPIDQT